MNTTHVEYPSVNLVSREFKANPFPFYARLRAELPVCRVTVPLMPGINEAWLVTRYDDVVIVLKDSHFAKSRLHASKKPWLPRFAKPLARNMLDLDEPDHTRLRMLVHKAFTPAMVERLQERIQEIADQLMDAVQQKGSMDLVRSAVTNSRVVVGERIPASISDFPTVCNQLSAALPGRLVCSATAND